MSFLVTLTILFLLPGSAVSEISYPNCTADSTTTYPWMFNSLAQGPCAVAAYMESACWGGSFSIQPLPSGLHYMGPDSSDASDKCMCTTIMYSLISACDVCQGSQWISWSEWITNCTDVQPPSSFPYQVPVGTSVPLWALLDVTLGNTWDLTQASAVGVYPEKTAGDFITASSTPAATSTSARNGATTSTSVTGIISAPSQSAVLLIGTPFAGPPISSTHPPTSTSTSSPSPTPSRDRTSDTGAIVGGVVGGIALIGIVIVSIVYIRRQRNDSPYATSSAYIAPSTLFVADVSQQSPTVQVSQQSPIVQVPPQSPTEHVSLKSPTEHVSLQSPTEHEGKKALSDDGTLVSSDMPESPVISPMVYNSDMATTLPEPQNDPYAPNIPNTAIFGQHQGSRNNPFQASRPQYHGLPTF